MSPFTKENAAQHGSKGGKKGGKARAKKLTKAQRRSIAVAAANKRWDYYRGEP